MAILSSPPDEPSPEPSFLVLGVKIGLSVLYYFFDSVLHTVDCLLHSILRMYLLRILGRNGAQWVYSVADSVSGFGVILPKGTGALSINGL